MHNYQKNEHVIIIKSNDIWNNYMAIIEKLTERINQDGKEPTYKVKIHNDYRKEKGDKRYASNFQYKTYSENDLILAGRICQLLYS